MSIKVDLSNVNEPDDFAPLPDGSYVCEVSDIEEDTTQAGDDKWTLELTVVEGRYEKRKVWDNLAFSPAALPRVKSALRAFDVNVDGEVDLSPDMLLGRRVKVSVFQKDYTNADGEVRQGNDVHFNGYSPCESVDTPF